MKPAVPLKKGLWERTNVQCLLRNQQSGRYYARTTVRGKQKWFSLETDSFEVAKLRLRDKLNEVDKQRSAVAHVAAGKATVGELIAVYLARTKSNPDLKPSSIASRVTAIKKLTKTWKEIEYLEPKQITPAAIFDWATRFKAEGTNFTPPGAKRAIRGNSPTSVNRAIDTLRALMEIAIEQGQIHSNPVLVKPIHGRLKKKITPKKLQLPSKVQVKVLIEAIENNGSPGGWGQEAADLCRFLVMSGARIGEVPKTFWRDIDWERRQLHLPGYKSETSNRFIPLFGPLEKLLQKIITRRTSAARFAIDGQTMLGRDDNIFRIQNCQKSIDTACVKTQVPRITHHDFRHLFATGCIEAGVDIFTTSCWLGHSDGGALAAKTYGHLRPQHSQAEAEKVKFDC